MLNGAAALGILSGGSPGGGPNLSALNLFRQINKNEAQQHPMVQMDDYVDSRRHMVHE